jgi:hypothetical protein
MAILFWGAKRRQWAVAETIRRSVKRVGTGLKNLTPRTPHKMTFSPIEKRRAGGAARKERPVPPRVQVPDNKKQVVESPTPKTPMWNKVFGR